MSMARRVPFLFPAEWLLVGPAVMDVGQLQGLVQYLAGDRWPQAANIGAMHAHPGPFFQSSTLFLHIDVMIEGSYFGALDVALFGNSGVIFDGSGEALRTLCGANQLALHSSAQVQAWLYLLLNTQRSDGDNMLWLIESWDDLPLDERRDLSRWEKTNTELRGLPAMRVTPLLGAKREFWRADFVGVTDGHASICRYGVKRDGLLSEGTSEHVAKNMPSLWMDGVIRRFRD